MQRIADVSSGGGTEELETLIDESGVLDSTDETVTEKVEQLIDKAEDNRINADVLYLVSGILTGFSGVLRNMQYTKFPRLDFKSTKTLSWEFSSGMFESVDYHLNTDVCTNFSATFSNCEKLVYVKGMNTSKAISMEQLFGYCPLLETIEEPLDCSSATNLKSMFIMRNATNNLKNVRFVTETIKANIQFAHSPLLTTESVQSIIDGLATVETAQTLTLNSAITLTDEQKATINAKGWTLAQ